MFHTGKNDVVPVASQQPERGFSLVEVIIALLILMIAVLGVFGVFAYATKLNTGNSSRSQALSVLQREVELLRSAKFTPTTVSSTTTVTTACTSADDGMRDITGGVKANQTRCGADGTRYLVETTVDDDPFTAGVQTAATTTLKEIQLTVTPVGLGGSWEAAYRTRVVFRRVRAN
jgi:Tfp pilus assembly protein PilV